MDTLGLEEDILEEDSLVAVEDMQLVVGEDNLGEDSLVAVEGTGEGTLLVGEDILGLEEDILVVVVDLSKIL